MPKHHNWEPCTFSGQRNIELLSSGYQNKFIRNLRRRFVCKDCHKTGWLSEIHGLDEMIQFKDMDYNTFCEPSYDHDWKLVRDMCSFSWKYECSKCKIAYATDDEGNIKDHLEYGSLELCKDKE
jgi:hypothetical protein